MPRIRVVSLAAVVALAVAVAAAGANAQTATNDQAGKPLALLAGLKPPQQTKASVHAKAGSKKPVKVAKRNITEKHRAAAAAQTPETPAPANPVPENVWPRPDQTTPANTAAAEQAAAPAADDPPLSAIVVNGQTVQIASPDDVNDIDLAADDRNAAPAAAARSDRVDMAPEATPVVATATRDDASPVGSASWVAQVFAALGGAIAAGSVAWFLIGSGPQRMYG